MTRSKIIAEKKIFFEVKKNTPCMYIMRRMRVEHEAAVVARRRSDPRPDASAWW